MMKTTLSAMRIGQRVQVLNCHLASTPSMFMTTVDLHCPGAIQITASHHPFNRNGLKFFTRDGGLEGSELSEILQLAEEGAMPPDAAAPGKITDTDYMTDYAAALRRTIQQPNTETPRPVPILNTSTFSFCPFSKIRRIAITCALAKSTTLIKSRIQEPSGVS